MGAIVSTGGEGFTGRHHPTPGREWVPCHQLPPELRDEQSLSLEVLGELFDLPCLVRVLKEHTIEQIVQSAVLSHATLSLDFLLSYEVSKRFAPRSHPLLVDLSPSCSNRALRNTDDDFS